VQLLMRSCCWLGIGLALVTKVGFEPLWQSTQYREGFGGLEAPQPTPKAMAYKMSAMAASGRRIIG
jgi:hypothetical protein